jgi:hypothetical protein
MAANPTIASGLLCVGTRSLSSNMRIGEIAECTYITRDGIGAVSSLVSTLGLPTVLVAASVSATSVFASTTVTGPHSVSLTGAAGAAVGSTVVITGSLSGGQSFTGHSPPTFLSPFTMTIVGTPTSASTMSCVGALSALAPVGQVHTGELVTCSITVRDASVVTTAEAADFLSTTVGSESPVTLGGTGLSGYTDVSTGAGASTFNFVVTSPAFAVVGATTTPTSQAVRLP